MKIIKLSTRIKFLLAAFFLCMLAMLLFAGRNEIFWEMLKKKNCDVAVYDFAGKNAMPFVARFFYQKSKNEFLIRAEGLIPRRLRRNKGDETRVRYLMRTTYLDACVEVC